MPLVTVKQIVAAVASFLAALLTAVWASAAPSAVPVGNVTIFIYHKFGEERYPTTNVTLENFARQLSFLRDNGYSVLPLARLADLLDSGAPLPDRAAVITIDDGYLSTYAAAWPLLRRHGYPFTVFLYTEAVERGYRNFLTWEQVAEMAAAGVDFQDHAYGHLRFGTPPVAGMERAAYGRWIKDDLRRSRELLTRRLGRPPEFLALPYGEYNAEVAAAARSLGYRRVLSQDPGSVSRFSGYILPREPILGIDWSTLAHFRMVLERVDLPYVDAVPAPGLLSSPAVGAFCVRLVEPSWYVPGTLGMYVSELGWRPATLRGRRACAATDTPLRRRANRVAVSARRRSDGRTAIRFHLLFTPPSLEGR